MNLASWFKSRGRLPFGVMALFCGFLLQRGFNLLRQCFHFSQVLRAKNLACGHCLKLFYQKLQRTVEHHQQPVNPFDFAAGKLGNSHISPFKEGDFGQGVFVLIHVCARSRYRLFLDGNQGQENST